MIKAWIGAELETEYEHLRIDGRIHGRRTMGKITILPLSHRGLFGGPVNTQRLGSHKTTVREAGALGFAVVGSVSALIRRIQCRLLCKLEAMTVRLKDENAKVRGIA